MIINKIFNWLGGGLFRTIGRFIGWVVIGFLLATILSKSDINITDLLGIETIKASEVQQAWVTNIQDSNGNWADSEFLGSWYVQKYASVDVVQQGGANLVPQISLPRHGDIYINGYLESSSYIFGNDLQMNCSAYAGDGITCVEWSLQDGSSVDLQFWLNSYGNQCKIEWNNSGVNVGNSSKLFFNATCQTQDRTIGTFYYYMLVKLGNSTSSTANYKLGISRSWKYEITASNTIQDQTEQQAEQHNETMSYFSDTNMTETNSTATSFFDNFSDTDHGGLSSIITAPLTVINSMLSNTCVAPSATWKGATITLPCGNMFWDRPGASDLRNLLNVFYGGFVCYYAIRRLFLLIEGMKDPTHDKIEVADL